MRHTPPKDIDEYIEKYPKSVQVKLRKIRATIRRAAPAATEAISYQIPTFKLGGNLIHFAAYPKHIGLYPTGSGVAKFHSELKDYEVSKGTIRFPLDKPIPYGLITRITRFRVKENTEREQKKRQLLPS